MTKLKTYHRKKSGFKPKFIDFLMIISILGFLSIAVTSFAGLDISKYITSGLFLVLGGGLLIEGKIRLVIKRAKRKKGFGKKTPHILTIVIGISAIVVGILNMVGIQAPSFEPIKGWLSVFAIIMILVERFWD